MLLIDDPQLSAATYLGLGAVALLVGFVKTGLPPLGIAIPVVLAMTLPAKVSVGTLLLYLVVGDMLAVLFYRRNADASELLRLVIPVAFGIAIGTCVLHALDDRALRRTIGGLVLAMVLLEVLRARLGDRVDLRHPALRFGIGGAAGIATSVANAAGPIMGIYFLSSGLDKARFMGTTAVFFLVVNVAKIPSFVYLDMIRAEYL